MVEDGSRVFQVARTHWITARVIGEIVLIEKLDSENSMLVLPTS